MATGAAGGAATCKPGEELRTLLPAYREWTASFGMWSPTAQLRKLGCINLHDRAFKDLVCAEGLAGAEDDAFATRLLEAALVGRTGDLRDAANTARVEALVAAEPALAVTESVWDLIVAAVESPTQLLARVPLAG